MIAARLETSASRFPKQKEPYISLGVNGLSSSSSSSSFLSFVVVVLIAYVG